MNTIYCPDYDKWAHNPNLRRFGQIKCKYCAKSLPAFVLDEGPDGKMLVGDCHGCQNTPHPLVTNPSTYVLVKYE